MTFNQKKSSLEASITTQNSSATGQPAQSSIRPRPMLTSLESVSVTIDGHSETATSTANHAPGDPDAANINAIISVGPLLDDIRPPLSLNDSLINDHVPASSSPLYIPGPQSCSSVGEPVSTLSTNSALVPGLNAANKSEARKFKTLDELNWCDREEVMANEGLFDWNQKRYLNIAETKRTKYADGFKKGSYFDNLIPIISANYVRAEKIVCCGRPIKVDPVYCDQWALCSRCAYSMGMNAVRMYQDTFNKTSFYHVTMSFDGDIPFGTTSSTDARKYWQANEAVITELVKDDSIGGAYLAHEIKIRQFLPLRILPHTHVVVAAPAFPFDLAKMLKGVDLKPSIDVKLIQTKHDLDCRVLYLTKAIELQDPYMSAWRKHCEHDRKLAPALNLEMKVFLDAQAAAFGGMYRLVRFGNLMSQRKTFIGVKVADRMKMVRKKDRKPNFAI